MDTSLWRTLAQICTKTWSPFNWKSSLVTLMVLSWNDLSVVVVWVISTVPVVPHLHFWQYIHRMSLVSVCNNTSSGVCVISDFMMHFAKVTNFFLRSVKRSWSWRAWCFHGWPLAALDDLTSLLLSFYPAAVISLVTSNEGGVLGLDPVMRC